MDAEITKNNSTEMSFLAMLCSFVIIAIWTTYSIAICFKEITHGTANIVSIFYSATSIVAPLTLTKSQYGKIFHIYALATAGTMPTTIFIQTIIAEKLPNYSNQLIATLSKQLTIILLITFMVHYFMHYKLQSRNQNSKTSLIKNSYTLNAKKTTQSISIIIMCFAPLILDLLFDFSNIYSILLSLTIATINVIGMTIILSNTNKFPIIL